MDYLPEPDIFHDIAGHVPMHTEKAFADTLVRFGDCAHTAVEITAGITDQTRAGPPPDQHHARHVALLLVHRGVRPDARPRAASAPTAAACSVPTANCEHAIDSDEVQRYPLQLEWVINQVAEIDHYQPILFIVDSFDHLFDLVDRLEQWMREGKLYNVAPGPARRRRRRPAQLHGCSTELTGPHLN